MADDVKLLMCIVHVTLSVKKMLCTHSLSHHLSDRPKTEIILQTPLTLINITDEYEKI